MNEKVILISIDGMRPVRGIAEQALTLVERKEPDFVFLHLVETDEKGGHDCGWMTEGYLKQLSNAFDCAEKIYRAASDRYHIIITADHGGHNRMHGEECPEDMTIPMFFTGKYFEPGRELADVSLLELAPTIAWLTGAAASREWEGKVVPHRK